MNNIKKNQSKDIPQIVPYEFTEIPENKKSKCSTDPYSPYFSYETFLNSSPLHILFTDEELCNKVSRKILLFHTAVTLNGDQGH